MGKGQPEKKEVINMFKGRGVRHSIEGWETKLSQAPRKLGTVIIKRAEYIKDKL